MERENQNGINRRNITTSTRPKLDKDTKNPQLMRTSGERLPFVKTCIRFNVQKSKMSQRQLVIVVCLESGGSREAKFFSSSIKKQMHARLGCQMLVVGGCGMSAHHTQ